MRLAAAVICALLGFGLLAAGLALIYPPAAFVAAGLALMGVGALAVDVRPRRSDVGRTPPENAPVQTWRG